MKKLRISKDLSLPLDVTTTTIAVLGIRNSGKTNTCVVLTEELLDAGQQVVIIDPTNVWWGLKSSKDGKSAGYPVVVFGGRHGDVPLAAQDGATVADFIVEERLPAILSLRHFESQADQRRFVTEFARRIYHRKGEEGRDTPMLLVVDEAHLFIPQRVGSAEAPMVGAMQKLVRQGRSSGIGVAIIDQRAASVNKDVLTQIELLICHRTTSPHDSRALEDWIEQNDTADKRALFLKKLPELERGTAWCWSPGWLKIFELVAVRERHTFDSSATPKIGEKRVTPTTLAHVDLDALKKRMANAIEKASAEDPKALRARIAQLERQLAGRGETKPESAREIPVIPWLSEADVGSLHLMLGDFQRTHGALLDRVQGELLSSAGKIEDVLEAWLVKVKKPKPLLVQGDSKKSYVLANNGARAVPPTPLPAPPAKKPAKSETNGSNTIEQKILRVFAQGGSMSKKKLAIWAGYAVTGGSFGQALANLRAAGHIVGSSNEMTITSEGRAVVKLSGDVEPLPKGEALLEWWTNKLEAGDGLILRALADRGSPMSREDIATAIQRSSTGGSYGQRLADLRALGLIEGSGKAYNLSPELQ